MHSTINNYTNNKTVLPMCHAKGFTWFCMSNPPNKLERLVLIFLFPSGGNWISESLSNFPATQTARVWIWIYPVPDLMILTFLKHEENSSEEKKNKSFNITVLAWFLFYLRTYLILPETK